VKEDEIKRDIESPVVSDDHASNPIDEEIDGDDINDDFGRELPFYNAISTHPSMDTDVDSTELYQEGISGIADVDEDNKSGDIYDTKE